MFLLAVGLLAQTPDPAYEPLSRAYVALRSGDYDRAIPLFLKAVEAAPGRAAIRKDLAYAWLKAGENELAREQFREAMRLEPADHHVALEHAFLCFETGQKVQARRSFDRIRRTGDPQSRATAEQAFRNIDGPLETGIARWKEAIRRGGGNFSAHYELATLAEQRDELELAAEHYEAAWRLVPDRRSVLVDLGRTWKSLNRVDQAHAALLAASRGGEPRAAESSRELLPPRYPYVPEFRAALALDPANIELRRELAYLLLRMERQPEAEEEFRIVTGLNERDVLSAAQLGFLYLARGDRLNAMPLLERVLRGTDEELANRVRAVLRLPQTLRSRTGGSPRAASLDAKEMAERSIRAGYMKDALKYLQMAHEADPVDFNVMLKLGWTYNILRQDSLAASWFNLARRSTDPRVAADAHKAWRKLHPGLARVRTSVWMFPFYSSRWRDVFSYGQIRTDVRVAGPLRPYVSARFIGDVRGGVGPGLPQNLSESSVILGIGVSTATWRGFTGWAEAGSAYNYLSHHVTPDYRGGLSFFRSFGRSLGAERPGWFAETTADGIFVSRFGDDVLVYSQNRFGHTASTGPLRLQLFLNANATADVRRQYWANFVEFGPGARFRWTPLSDSLFFTLNLLRGAHTTNRDNPRSPNFFDLRAGFGYAFSY
ncbi:MAG TPA: tetratricopeptide repeat protein [Bryobacteraceae bacterium]|nr:tetratricopeptide repeat protein [Bryobacteraceae bacterium]